MQTDPAQKENSLALTYLGLDFGDKTIGVSVSSPNGRVAVGVTTLTRLTPDAIRSNLKELKSIIREYNVNEIVIGYPLHMDGGISHRAEKTLVFKQKLDRYFKIPTHLWDERLSTRAVSRAFEGSLSNISDRSRFNKHVDEMAAAYILQGFLDFKNLELKI